MIEPTCLIEDAGEENYIFCSWCNTEADPEFIFGTGPTNYFCSEQCYDDHTEIWG